MKTPIAVLKTHLALDTSSNLANLPQFEALAPSTDQRDRENPRSWWNVNAECRIAYSREGLNQYIAICLGKDYVAAKDLPDMPDANARRYGPQLQRKLIKTCGKYLEADECKTLKAEAEEMFSVLSSSQPSKVYGKEMAELNKQHQKAKSPVKKERLVKKVERGGTGDWMKDYRKHKCQICEKLGTNPEGFKTRKGIPYTEAHHVDQVGTGGSLGLENIIVVCANHHRQMHYGNVEILQTASGNSEFIFRIDGGEIRVDRFQPGGSD